MAKRKTIKVEDLRVSINQKLRHSECSADMRHGMCMVLEEQLHATGNYSGFKYLTAELVPEGHAAGVNFVDGELAPQAERFIGTDETRRHYF